MRLRFASFLLDLRLGTLQGPDGERHLRPQTFKLLELLARESPRILGSDEILDEVWGTEHLSESSVRQAISELRQALGDSASTPTVIETVHRRGYRMIAEVERLPTQDEHDTATAAEPSAPDRRRRGRWRVALRATAVVLLALWVQPRPDIGGLEPSAQPSIAILGLEAFDAESSQLSWLAAAVREMLRFELGVAGTARLASDEEVEWARRTLGIDDRSALSAAELRQLGQKLGVRWVVHGSYFASDASDQPRAGRARDIQIHIQISDTVSGEVLGWARERGPSRDILDIVNRLLRSVRAQLPTDGEPPALRHVAAQHWLASSADSLRLFAQGAEALARRDGLTARGFLEQAVAVDPDNPLHHSALASAYQSLGLGQHATASADRSAQLARDLPWEHRLSVTARADQIAGRCDQAAESLSTLHRRFPDDPDYGLRLSQSLYCAGRLEPALEALRSLRTRRGLGTSGVGLTDLRIDLREVRLLVALNRLDDAGELAARAVDSALERDAPMLAADGLAEQFWIRFRQGQWPAAEAALEQLETLLGLEDTRRHAVVQSCLAALRHRQGRTSAAREAHERALALYRRIGDRKGEAASLNNYASLLNNLGDTEGMVDALSRSIELKRETGERGGLVTSLSNLASILVMQGQLERAAPLLADAEEIARGLDDPHRLALSLRSQGRLAEARGQAETAEAKYRESLTLSEQIEEGEGVAWSHRGLAGALHAQGRDERASEHFRRAIAVFERHGNLPEAVATRCRLAQHELSQGNLENARQLYDEVLDLTESSDLPIYEAEARQGLAQLAHTRGELDTARRELRAAIDLWQRAGNDDRARAARDQLGSLGG